MQNSIHVTPANNGYVVSVEGKDYNSETFVFPTSEALIEAWPGLLKVKVDPEFAEVDQPETTKRNVYVDMFESAGRIFSSVQAAAADEIVTVTKDGSPFDFGFMNAEVARVAANMVRFAGGDARITKSRDGKSDPAVTQETDTAAPTAEARSTVYVVWAGTRDDEERTMTVVYDEDAAKRMCEVVWLTGGSARMRPAIVI